MHVGSLCIGFVIGKRTVRDRQILGKAMQLCSALMQGISILLVSGKQSLSRPVFPPAKEVEFQSPAKEVDLFLSQKVEAIDLIRCDVE